MFLDLLLNVGIRCTARESIPFPGALDQRDLLLSQCTTHNLSSSDLPYRSYYPCSTTHLLSQQSLVSNLNLSV